MIFMVLQYFLTDKKTAKEIYNFHIKKIEKKGNFLIKAQNLIRT